MKKSIIGFQTFVFLFIALFLLAGCGKEDAVIDLKQEVLTDDPQLTTNDVLAAGAQNGGSSSISDINDSPDSEPPEMTVYVCGAVNRPGVYTLKDRPRVVDAIEAAGGMNDRADSDYINQAMLLSDGQKIYVPTTEETENAGNMQDVVSGLYGDAGTTEENNGKVNINTADAAQLMTLPGIGKAKAALIIEYRTNCGRFDSIEDIMKINGIKEGMFNRIRDRICI